MMLLFLASFESANALSQTNDNSSNEFVQKSTPKLAIETYVTGRRVQHDQWLLQCMNSNITDNEKCNLIHQINNQKNQQIIKIEALKTAGVEAIIFYLPLGLYLPAGAKLIIGKSEYLMPITTCLVSGCQAKVQPNLNLKQQFLTEAKAIVQLLHINQKQNINIEFSLMGFSKGIKEIL